MQQFTSTSNTMPGISFVVIILFSFSSKCLGCYNYASGKLSYFSAFRTYNWSKLGQSKQTFNSEWPKMSFLHLLHQPSAQHASLNRIEPPNLLSQNGVIQSSTQPLNLTICTQVPKHCSQEHCNEHTGCQSHVIERKYTNTPPKCTIRITNVVYKVTRGI